MEALTGTASLGLLLASLPEGLDGTGRKLQGTAMVPRPELADNLKQTEVGMKDGAPHPPQVVQLAWFLRWPLQG